MPREDSRDANCGTRIDGKADLTASSKPHSIDLSRPRTLATMAAQAGPSTSNGTSNQPNASLYIKNLNTKTKKPELRRQLYSLFSTYGKVIDIVATRAEGMRGQAFVVFGDLRSATAARRALDGFEFYERSIVSCHVSLADV